MSSQRFIGGLLALALMTSCQMAMAIAPAPLEPAISSPPPAPAPAGMAPSTSSSPSSYYVQPQNPAALEQPDLPAPVAQPANGPATSDASTTRKFYTLTASLREVFDDNVNTSNNNAKSALETILSPSALVNFPDKDGDFSGRYTLGLTYYSHSPQNNGNGSSSNSSGGNDDGELQVTHEVVAAYSHQFSDRFSLAAAEAFRYFTEPSILQSTGTNYQNGPYISNIVNGSFTAQWTPIFSSTTTLSDTIVRYQDSVVADTQDSVENTGSTTLGYSVLPKLTANLGGIIDYLTYQTADRGYTNYTGFAGVTWQALPSLNVVARGGATYTEPAQTQFPGLPPVQPSLAPYIALNVYWSLGARSSLSFAYSHEITPSDQVGANGQISDRFNANFSYLITPRLSAFLDGVFTYATYSGALSSTNASPDEQDYSVDSGLTFTYNSSVNFTAGITNSGVLSKNNNNNYTRDEVYVGVRGTY